MEKIKEKMRHSNSTEDRTSSEILLSLFTYHLFEIAAQDEIAIQTMIHNKNQVSLLVVNLDNVHEISELFKLIHWKGEGSDAYTYSLPKN